MVDRQPTHAGRVHLAPVSGQQNTFDMTMADGATEQGTPLNKANLLKDATAALFGLPNTAVPDDVFAWLGKYNTHCWGRRTAEFDAEEVKTDITSEVMIVNMENRPIQYSQSVSINAVTGEISLVNPQTITVNGDSTYANQLKALAPCYIKNASEDPTAVYYMPSGATTGGSSSSTIHYTSSYLRFGNAATSSIRAKTVTADITATYGEWELLFSTNRNDYPDSGVQDGYEYKYLGIPFESLTTVPRIETGSYVGTGTYGKSNPNVLSLSFRPTLFGIVAIDNGTNRTIIPNIIVCDKSPLSVYEIYSGTQQARNDYSFIANEVSWYSGIGAPNASTQHNEAGRTYYYIAIG